MYARGWRSSTKERPQQFVQSVRSKISRSYLMMTLFANASFTLPFGMGNRGTSFSSSSSSSSCSPLPCPLHLSVIALLRSRLLLAWPLSLWSTSLISVSHRSSSSQWLGPSFLFFFFFICLPLRLLHSSSTPSTQQPSSSPCPALCCVCVCVWPRKCRKEGQNDWGARLTLPLHACRCLGLLVKSLADLENPDLLLACPTEFRRLLIRLSHKSLSNLVCVSPWQYVCIPFSQPALLFPPLYHLLVLWSGVSGLLLLQNRWEDEGVCVGSEREWKGSCCTVSQQPASLCPSANRSLFLLFCLCLLSLSCQRPGPQASIQSIERASDGRGWESGEAPPLNLFYSCCSQSDWLTGGLSVLVEPINHVTTKQTVASK